MKLFLLAVGAALVAITAGCSGCPRNQCVVGWTYQYTPQGGGAGQWVMTPQYAP